MLAALAELEPERSGFCLPMLDEVTEPCVLLGTAGSKGCQFHPLGGAVTDLFDSDDLPLPNPKAAAEIVIQRLIDAGFEIKSSR